MKKTMLGVVAFATAGAIALAGCSSSGGETTSSASPTTGGSAVGSGAEDITLWLMGTDTPDASLGMIEWGQVMAASTLVAVPVIIFFLIVQSRMTKGLVGGAVKG